MKKIRTVFFAIIILISAGNLFAQGTLDDAIWSIVNIDSNALTKVHNPDWQPAEPIIRYFNLGDGVTVFPNFRPKPTTNTTQSEMSVDVHPTNNNIIFASANASNWPVSTIFGTGVYWSTDGSTSWTGFDQPPFGSNAGDPVSVIGFDGRWYENYITGAYGQGVAVSTNNGVNCTSYTIPPNPGQLADKNHFMVDNM